MSRRLRGLFEGMLTEVTTRTQQARFLLRPSPMAVAIMKGVIARAQERYGMEICGGTALSNHAHYLVVPESTKQLSGFMRYVNSNPARKLGKLYGWKGKFLRTMPFGPAPRRA